jgi:protein-disulfide isomerase
VSKAARDQNRAKRIVELQRAAERRRRVTLWTSVSVVLVLVVAGLVAWTVVRNQDNGKVVVPPGAVDDGTAFAVGSGPVTLDLYEDFLCPICHEFENQSGATIKQWVADKKVTVRYHPVAILDGSSNGTKYSSRAAGAAAAAAQDGKLVEFHDVLYANQPEENSSGLTNAKLIELGKSVGLTSTAFTGAVNNQTYVPWAGQVTDTFAKRGYTGTPTILVNNKVVAGAKGVPTTAELTAAVNAAAG